MHTIVHAKASTCIRHDLRSTKAVQSHAAGFVDDEKISGVKAPDNHLEGILGNPFWIYLGILG